MRRFLSLAFLFTATLHAQQLSAADKSQIDAAVQEAVQKTGVPSVSVGIARGGGVVYAKAFGTAQLSQLPMRAAAGFAGSLAIRAAVPADAAMAYPIGSISKQFTAACILLLQERGKLKLDDPVSKWFPEFTRANEVTIRNLLTHTSGYSDYAPQDYTIPAWTRPVDSTKLMHEWATKPLDFDPGTKWQYSNSNFVIAALILQKVSGQTYHHFLWQNIIAPLHLQNVYDLDTDRDKLQVRGYEHHALGPLRPAILEAPGWYFGDANLAMPVATLLEWDESLVHRTLLKPESYDAMFAEYLLKDGTSSHYGLGVFSREVDGKRVIYHSGEVGGFVSNNVVDVTVDVAYAALTNLEGPGANVVTSALRPILLPSIAPAPAAAAAPPEQKSLPEVPVFGSEHAAQMKSILEGLQKGRLDRKVYTADTLFYFNGVTLADYKESLSALGAIESVTQTGETLRGGMVQRNYEVKFGSRTLSANTYTQKDGKIEQLLVNAE